MPREFIIECPHLKNLRTKEAELPPTQLNPKAGSGKLV
jgi:hypothetical protein